MANVTAIGTRKPVKLVQVVQVTGVDRETTEADGQNYKLWADVKRISGNRAFQRGVTQLEEGLYFRVRFRFTYNPDAKYKIIYNGHRYTVRSIEPEEEKNFYWIIKADTAHE